jgi:hypothetical protein
MRVFIALSFCVWFSACGPVMEATRPDPVDITQFVPGQKRISILAEIGNPVATSADGANSCDIYKLFTRGPGSVGKGVIAAGEAVGDVLTLGLSEVLWTPAEAATRNSKHTVLFCYGSNNTLASVRESDSHLDD